MPRTRLGAWLGKEGDVTVSCVPVEGDVHVRLLARGATRALAEAALAPVEADVRAALGVDCYGQDDDLLEAVVGRLLLERGWTVSVAESCTGGLLGHRLTNIAGSSRYVERGVIVYSNRAKEELLGVPEPLLRAHGAVSAPVAAGHGGGRLPHLGLALRPGRDGHRRPRRRQRGEAGRHGLHRLRDAGGRRDAPLPLRR